jgi:sugar lactone lactonase YvrE
VTTDGDEEVVLEVEGQPSGLGWMPDGSLLVVSMKDQRVLRRADDGSVSLYADVSDFCGGNLNDMVVSADGHAYVGNFGFDLMGGADPVPANLIHIDPEGGAGVGAEGLVFPNGSVITPDGSTLIVGETAGARYTAFAIQADGSLGERRVWAQVAPEPELGTLEETLGQLRFGPDGCTLDAEGQIWSADEVNARCARIAEGGEVTDEIAAPEGLNIFACALGGPDGRTLLACAAPDFHEEARTAAREAVLLTVRVDAPHAGLP